MKDLPESEDEIAQWCRDQFVTKVNIMYFTDFSTWSKIQLREANRKKKRFILTHSNRGSVIQDALLDKHIAADTFPGQKEQNIGRPIKSLAVSLLKTFPWLHP